MIFKCNLLFEKAGATCRTVKMLLQQQYYLYFHFHFNECCEEIGLKVRSLGRIPSIFKKATPIKPILFPLPNTKNIQQPRKKYSAFLSTF